MYDIIVVGGGPAGMTAALYGLRNGKTVMVIEKAAFGGQITYSPRVENIPGFTSISGNEFADRFMEQIISQGAELEFDEVTALEDLGSHKTVTTLGGNTFEAKSVIIATGVKHRMLGLPGEEELVGNGISFCAVCDGDFYTGRRVCVAGGGNSAFVEAVLLAEKCSEVIMLQDLPEYTADKSLQKELLSHSNVSGRFNTKITGFETAGDGEEFKGVRIENKETGEEEIILCDGLFVAIGLIPENDIFAGFTELDERGYFDSDESCVTKTEGIFVAGDCRRKDVRQVSTAIADGANAALKACAYLRKTEA
ncbi:MAG: FAD-dependent oxidoreductase [Eubacteriales bacterium]|nr:FAD-dependent oxidoreductase [Eubacteriales bacterium]